ncbi:MAG: hypothetical protein LBL04_08660 [Bacteroidales bacterium]|nr:hypothetical protein [Bacteroidales bacterium]
MLFIVEAPKTVGFGTPFAERERERERETDSLARARAKVRNIYKKYNMAASLHPAMGGFSIDYIHREEPQACPALSTMHDPSIDLLIKTTLKA